MPNNLPVVSNTEAISLSVEQARVIEAVSPTIDAERVADGVKITVEDFREQPQTVKLNDGETPIRGQDYWTEGDKAEIVAQTKEVVEEDYTDLKSHVEELDDHVQRISPRASVSKTGDTATITISDQTGTSTVQISDGEKGGPGDPGEPGQDGVSPTVTITEITGGHRITITDATGAHSADVMDGEGAVQDVQVNGVSVLSDGVANVPLASSSKPGAVRVDANYGIRLGAGGTAGMLLANMPDESIIKAYNNPTGATASKRSYQPITPSRLKAGVFYGLSEASGDITQSSSSNAVGNYTENAKSKISEMLNGSVSVFGTTPTINAMPGVRYVCGEVSTLDITLPASGIVDVVFESGSTPTVLTVTPPTGMTVEWANGFDSTALEADTVYEVNIMTVGTKCLGVAGTWT